jgi:hypothetical protein
MKNNLFRWLTFGLLCSIVLGQLQRFQVTPTVAVYVHDVIMVLIVVLGFQLLLKKPMPIHLWRSWWLELTLVVWLVLGLVGAAVNGHSLLPSALYLGRLSIYSLGVFFILKNQPFKNLLHQLTANQTLRFSLIVTGFLVLGMGLVQYLLMPDMRFLKLLGWDDHYYRLISTQFDPGFAGMLLLLTLVQVATFRPLPLKLRWLGQAALVLGIALTFSRSTYLALVVTLLALFMDRLWKGQLKVGLGFVGLALWLGVLIPFLPRPSGEGVRLARLSTVVARTTRTQEIIGEMQPYQWLVGRGVFVPITSGNPQLGGQALPDHARVADNLLVFFLTSTGIIGACLTLGIFVKWFWQWRFAPAALISLGAVITHSLFNNTLFQPFIWIYLWLSLGTLIQNYQRDSKSD